MARIPRKFLIENAEVGVYHCINRCVRRAFLCGTDEFSGKNFDHRKQWIQDRLEFLAGVFGIDVMGFAVMSNHLHLVLRNRPDVVAGWSDEEVARRWWRLFPGRRDADGSPARPTEVELRLVTGHAERLAEIRSRLSSVSWFMRCVAEPIARQANREDECSGRFWEGRYRCQPLLDESAVLAGMAYVDLNPIRAKIAATPETSRFTSVFERIQAARDLAAESADAVPKVPHVSRRGSGWMKSQVTSKSTKSSARAEWLSPLPVARELAEERRCVPAARASNKGCLPMSLADYLRLLDWTGRQLRRDKRGAIPEEVAPILQRLKVSDEGWLHLVRDFSRMFRRAAGTPATLAKEATRRGHRWLKGISSSRATFASP
jgi:hypothetical protein